MKISRETEINDQLARPFCRRQVAGIQPTTRYARGLDGSIRAHLRQVEQCRLQHESDDEGDRNH